MPLFYIIESDGGVIRSSDSRFNLSVTRDSEGIFSIDYSDMNYTEAPFVYITTDTTGNSNDSTSSSSIKECTKTGVKVSLKNMAGALKDSRFHLCIKDSV